VRRINQRVLRRRMSDSAGRFNSTRTYVFVGRARRTYTTLVLITILLAPLYWFYSVDPELISTAKKSLFALLFLIATLGYRRVLVRSVSRILTSWLVLIVSSATVSVFAADAYYLELAGIATFILLCYASGLHFRRSVGECLVDQTLRRSGYIFAALSAMVIAGWLSPEWNPANPLFSPDLFQSVPHLASTAYGQARTGWAATAVVFLGFLFLGGKDKTGVAQLAGALLITASLVVLSTRSGMLLAVAVILYWVYQNKSRITWRTLSVVAILAVSAYVLLTEYAAEFRLDSIIAGDINAATTGRYELLGNGIDPLIESPWIGSGQARFFQRGYEDLEIHNVPINYAIRFGLPLVILLFVFIGALLSAIVRGLQFATPSQRVALFAIIASISTLLWEPQTVISYGHHVFPVWFALGALYQSRRT